MLGIIVLVVLLICGLAAFFSTLYVVKEGEAVIVQRLGRFLKVAYAGLNFKIPFIDFIAHEQSLRVEQLNIECEVKTKDSVFVMVKVAIQTRVGAVVGMTLEKAVMSAFYKLTSPDQQISAYVFDSIRSKVPAMTLDETFEKKDDIAVAVQAHLEEKMREFGHEISSVLVVNIQPDSRVKDSMNEINAAKRLREAANEQGEAKKILKIKEAEAESAAKKLQGEGIAAQRAAIVEGLKSSVEAFQASVAGTSAQDVMNLVLMTQYFDTMKEMGAGGARVIFMPHSPSAVGDLRDQITHAVMAAGEGVKPE